MFIDEIARLQARELERQMERSARNRALLGGRSAPARWLRGLSVRHAHPGDATALSRGARGGAG